MPFSLKKISSSFMNAACSSGVPVSAASIVYHREIKKLYFMIENISQPLKTDITTLPLCRWYPHL